MATRAHPTLQRALLGEAVDTATLAVFVFEDDEHFAAANDAACELSGYSREELLSLHLRDLAADPEQTVERLADVAAGQRRAGKTKMRRKDGSTIDVAYRVAPSTIAGMPFIVAVYWRV